MSSGLVKAEEMRPYRTEGFDSIRDPFLISYFRGRGTFFTHLLSNTLKGRMQDISRDVLMAASGGDRDAFETIYRASSGFVYSIACRITGNVHSAQDVTQDVFLKVYKNLNRFRFRSSFKTWIYRITVNSALNSCRRISKRLSKEVEYNDALNVTDSGDSPRETVERGDNEELLKSMLSVLNPDQRACIVLRGIDGLSYREIAEVLDVNINTVRSRLKRAREILLARFKKGSDAK
jgi:RNA polymerase sigma-70 factor (ECF subfamily)